MVRGGRLSRRARGDGLEFYGLREDTVVRYLCLEKSNGQQDVTEVGFGAAATSGPEPLDIIAILVELEDKSVSERAVTTLVGEAGIGIAFGEAGPCQGMQEYAVAGFGVSKTLQYRDAAVISLQ